VAVRLPDYKAPLFLVVLKGFGIKTMMLLTSCTVNIPKKEHMENNRVLSDPVAM
jgi:hypothetical protein